MNRTTIYEGISCIHLHSHGITLSESALATVTVGMSVVFWVLRGFDSTETTIKQAQMQNLTSEN